jgi:thiamine biosynthesis protein ThiI
MEGRSFDSFCVRANRADKTFAAKSDEINRELGDYVRGFTGARVDLTNPDLQISLDVMPKATYVHFDEVRGHGGLPVGVSGDVTCMLSGGIDSPVAAWQMMRRGCRVHFVHFHSYPLVDRSSIEKAMDLTSHLTRHQYQSTLALAPLGDIQKSIIVSTPPAYRVILYRRFMLRIAEALGRAWGAKATVTGESCGQVSSQTLDNIAVIDDVAGSPVLRPLIGSNKEEIVNAARAIGTFPISVQPDQDCCSLFVPRHPETHAQLGAVSDMESRLPVAELVQGAVDAADVRKYAFPGDEAPLA